MAQTLVDKERMGLNRYSQSIRAWLYLRRKVWWLNLQRVDGGDAWEEMVVCVVQEK